MLTSLPINLLHDYHVEATKAIAIKDKDLLDSLEAVGFKLNPYPGGLFLKVGSSPSSRSLVLTCWPCSTSATVEATIST